MPADNSTAVSEESETQKSLLKRLFGLYEIILIVLILLAIIGIGITDFSPAESHRYWFAMVPVFAGACLILEWSRARGKGQKWTTILRTQLLLWVGLLLAVRLVYLLLHTGRLDNENTGLIILLLLALTTFFAGIQVDRQVALFGSVNLDVRSFWLDFEVILGVYDADFAERLLALQNEYIKDAIPVDLQTWQQRPGKERFIENLARLASPLL